MMPPTHRKPDPQVSFFDVFLGKGRTIRTSKLQDETKHKANEAKKLQSRDAKQDGSKEVDTKDNKPSTDWTPAQDAKLLEMKAANKSWKEIGTEIGRPKYIAQPRFKELRGQGMTATGADRGKDKGITHHEQAVAEKKKKKWEAMASAKKGSQGKKEVKKGKETQDSDKRFLQAKAGAEKRYTLAQLSKVEDRDFPIRELGIIADLVARLDGKEKSVWEVVASRYFDCTGCRVDGEDLRDRFEALDRA